VNIENFCELLERWGHRTIRGKSTYWAEMSRGLFLNLPPYGIIDLGEDEMARLFSQPGVLGLKYSTEPQGDGQPGAIYLLSDKSYDLTKVHRKARHSIRQGLRTCRVKQISFDELEAKGMQANLDTLSRQKRDDPTFSQPERWANFCHVGGAIEGAGAWGAFVTGKLAAYAVTVIIDDYCNILYEMSRTDMMDSQANPTLIYTIHREMLALPGINHISGGPTSILDLPDLDRYKTRLGYEKRPVHFKVKLRPWLNRLLLNPAGQGTLSLARRVVPNLDLLKRADSILSIALASR
jgi:hypothetical protein